MRILLPLLLALPWLQACSPEQNWRQVAFEGSALKAQLPCKPDRTVREVPLGGTPLQLAVAGCESGPAMLAVMTAALPAGADAQAILLGWQQATLTHLQAGEPDARSAWLRPGMLPLAAAQQLHMQGRRGDGRPVAARAVWGAFSEGDHVRLVHAVIYADSIQADLAQGLFEGLRP